ncbi:MAG: ABC transporter permease, partial [Gemmatimonadota bacterium]|nr:ABC transporter permease [Gemmatimonadota bacterium]
MRRPASRVGLVILATLVLGAAIGPVLAPQSPYLQDLDHRLVPPGDGHLLGTDEFGRDILSRLLYGTRISLTIGMVSVGIGLLAGGLLGLVTGYLGGRVDMIGMRVVDVLLAFPGILLAVVIVAILGPSLTNAMIAVGI